MTGLVGKRIVWRIGMLAVVMAMIGLLTTPVGAQDTQNFVIRSMDSTYRLSRDSQHISKLQVQEKISAEFPSFDQNHGILRALPQTYKNHPVDLTIDKVTDSADKSIRYTTGTSNDNLVLQIGDPDKYVHGLQEYDISYHMQNVTAKFADHDELFWDVNGNQWEQPFDAVSAHIYLPKDLATELNVDKRCYTGQLDSQQASCSITTQPSGQETVVNITTTRTLNAGETLSYVLGFKSGTFAEYKVPLSQILWTVAAVVLLGIVPPALTLYILLKRWRKYGQDAKGRGIIVPQYLPPKDISVLESSGVLKQRFVPAAVSAQILDLAVRHYFKIYEKTEKKVLKDKTSYSVELIKTSTGLHSEEKEVIEMLFGLEPKVGDQVDLGDLSSKLYKKAVDLGKTIDSRLAAEGYFTRPPQQIFQSHLIWGIVLCVVGFVFPPYTLGLLLCGVVVMATARLMPARTQKGVEVRDYLYGLRDYMKLAEAERIKVLQSPKGELTEKVDVSDNKQLIKLYEKLLPYAMLFGIEREWAKEFADMYHDNQPDWYSGSGAFNAIYFAGALHTFSTVSAATFAPPSNSSSSGFGGGGAGGGGGGGGGGGW
jgi:hypothetical protein